MRKKRLGLFVFILLAAACLLLTACSAGPDAKAADSGDTQQEVSASVKPSADAETGAASEDTSQPAERASEDTDAPGDTDTPNDTAAPDDTDAPDDTQTGGDSPAAADQTGIPTLEDALAFVDMDVSEMIAAIGEPLESSYEYSCSGPGDDGILTYPGFIVFTYREPDGSAETVLDAEAE